VDRMMYVSILILLKINLNRNYSIVAVYRLSFRDK
jgi:hypothetical protein